MRFDSCAQSYDVYAAPQRAFAACVAEFARHISAGDILELGAGTGALTRHLCARPGVAVRATDASAAMVAVGQSAVPQASWAVLDAFAGDLPRVAFQVSSGLLQWARDPAQVLSRWRDSLVPSGRMVHAFPCEPCLAEWRQLVTASPIPWRTEASWCALFDGAGLVVERKALWKREIAFPSSLEMLQALHRSGVTGAPHLDAGRLRRAMRDYDRLHRGPEGVIATWAWLAIEATIRHPTVAVAAPRQ